MNEAAAATAGVATHTAGFTASEYARRVGLVRERMATLGVEALLVDCVEHMAYLFGYVPPAAIYQPAILPLEGDPVAIVRALDQPMFEEQSWVRDAVVFADDEDSVTVLARTCRERGLAEAALAVEFDSNFLPVNRFRAIETALPKVRFVDFSRVIWEIRLLKSGEEIACLRRAGEIADAALMAAVETAAAGVSERECAAAFYATALKAGADNGRNLLLAGGKRSGSLHGRLGDHRLAPGDILRIESIPLYRGYGARIMRSTVIGEPEPDLTHVANTLIVLQDRQFDAMRPGARAGDIDRILREGVVAAGLREYYDNYTGYTLGYIGLPVTSDFTRAFLANSDWLLESNMVFHMYTYAQGLAFSDTILVTDEGAERLTGTERRLFVR